ARRLREAGRDRLGRGLPPGRGLGLRLRARLALTALATAAPLLAGIAWLRADLERRDAERSLADFALVRMESGGKERCETDPAFFSITAAPAAAPRATGTGGRPVVDLGARPG